MATSKKNTNKKDDIKKIQAQNEQLQKILNEKDRIINDLNNQIKKINAEYVTKIQAKMQEANTLIEKKVNDLNKQAASQIQEIKKYAFEHDAVKLIQIINQFERVVSFETPDEKLRNYQQGFKMFLILFKNLLNDLSINEINVKPHDIFDPQTMQIMETKNDQNFKNNEVIKVMSKGYKLHDRVIVPAMVQISKKKN